MKIYEIYSDLGLSCLPVSSDKRPIGKWTRSQTEIVRDYNYSQASGIGVVCGKVSGGLTCLDLDLKYDTTGTLHDRFKQAVTQLLPALMAKLVIQSTPSGGYHWLFRCDEVDGNQKLARRFATEEEKARGEKVLVLLETRGEGGYFLIAPSKGYKIISGDISNIPRLTPQEKDLLFDCARSFDEAKQEVSYRKVTHAVASGTSPFEDYDNRADVIGLLESNGWKVAFTTGNRTAIKRPGDSTQTHSGFYDEDKKWFSVFSTSTIFDPEKAYKPYAVFAYLECNKDFQEASRRLYDMGYGDRRVKQELPKIEVIDTESFIADGDETDIYLQQVRDGSFKMGLSTGFIELNQYFRFKPANLTIILGIDNVGKTDWMLYMAVISAKLHNWNWIIYSGENKTGGVKKKLMQFIEVKPLDRMTDEEFNRSKTWVEDHFVIIKNDDIYTYKDLMAIGKKLCEKKTYNAFMIDPYNSLYKDLSKHGDHQYDYVAMSDFRQFSYHTGCGIYLNCHTVTEAGRRVYDKDHEYAGHPKPPNKLDAEGGGKFANRADDFIVLHRMTQHPTAWVFTEVHVKKIKEVETGGRCTFLELPYKMRLSSEGCGFEDTNGFNPIIEKKEYIQSELKPNTSFYEKEQEEEPEEEELEPPF